MSKMMTVNDKDGKHYVKDEAGNEVEVMTKREAMDTIKCPHIEYIGTLIEKGYVTIVGYTIRTQPKTSLVALVNADQVREYALRYKKGENDPTIHRRELKMPDDRFHDAIQALLVIQMGDVSLLTENDRKALVELTQALQNSRDITARNAAARKADREERRSTPKPPVIEPKA